MKEPKRLFEGGNPLERTILGYGRDEAPAGDLARKTLAAMAAAPATSASEKTAESSWFRPKWLLGGACALGLAAVVAGFVQRTELPEPAPPPASGEPMAPQVENTAPPRSADAPPKDEVVVTPDSLPSAPARSAAAPAPNTVPRAANPTTPTPASSASIAREVELLDTVKAKLGAGDAPAAARALDAYDAEFPAGTLRPEATVLRVRTLLARGDRASAEKVGSEFLAKHPAGVHAKRVRALLSEGSGAGGSGLRRN